MGEVSAGALLAEKIPLEALGQQLVQVRARVRVNRTNNHLVWALGSVVADTAATLCGARVKHGWVPGGPGAKFDCVDCRHRARRLT